MFPDSTKRPRALTWACYYDDVPAHVVRSDVGHHEVVAGDRSRPRHGIAAWHSTHAAEQVTSSIFTPGIIAAEAAATAGPVLSAVGERDLIVDLAGEARAFRSAPSFELFVCPRMGPHAQLRGNAGLAMEQAPSLRRMGPGLDATSRRLTTSTAKHAARTMRPATWTHGHGWPVGSRYTNFGYLPQEAVLESITLLGDYVIPELKKAGAKRTAAGLETAVALELAAE